MSNINKSKSIYTLPRPIWLDAAGLAKGIHHDRQHLGIILAAGQTLRIRQSDAAFNSTLTLQLLNDDRKTEAAFNVGKDWIEASVSAISVPFIDTPYNDGTPVVEFEYPNTAKTLPVYRQGENETAFFNHWDNQDAEFGLIESEYANLLAPKVSKNTLKDFKKIEEVKNIDGLISYYNRIFTFYNALAGISFEPERSSDLNIKNRHFMKADANGPGAAFYGYSWAADSSKSISGFWLTPKDSNWGPLHEIGHGYQGNFMGDKYFSASELWNNIYASCYQNVMLGEQKNTEGWLYSYGNRERVDNIITGLINNQTPVNQWDLRSKLNFCMLMIDKAGPCTFTHFNQNFRQKCNESGYVPSDYALLDMLSESFAVAGEQVDVTPFILLTGGYISQKQRQRNVLIHAKPVYPLYKLVDTNQLDTVKKQLKLDSSLQLVDSSQLQATGLKGTITINFTIDDFAQIYGKDLILMEGSRYAFKTQLNNPTMVLNDLPIGVYTLRLPSGTNSKYQLKSDYLVVKQGESVAEIQFVKKFSSSLISQEIRLAGISDSIFATVMADYSQGKLVIDVYKTTPHSFFSGKIYAKILVRDPQGLVMFSKDIYGTEVTLSHDELPFTSGYKIEIFHSEPNRLKVSPADLAIIDNKNKTNLLTLTKFGLANEALQSEPQQRLLVRLKGAVENVRNDPQAYYAPSPLLKDDIYLAINVFDSPQREQLLVTYKDCIPVDNTYPDDKIGNAFTVIGKGISNHTFLTSIVDLVKKTLTVKIEARIAHHYFTNIYASFEYEDADGNILYSDKIIGIEGQQARSVELPISGYGGEIIRIHHEEPDNRLIITNDMRHLQFAEKGKQQTYRITTMGLERIAD